jgi:hypothetical protein
MINDDRTVLSLKLYIKNNIRTGSFLRAVLANDLMRACQLADVHNRIILAEVAELVRKMVPKEIRGSYSKVDEHLERKRREGNEIK